jgi:hypothetical protein
MTAGTVKFYKNGTLLTTTVRGWLANINGNLGLIGVGIARNATRAVTTTVQLVTDPNLMLFRPTGVQVFAATQDEGLTGLAASPVWAKHVLAHDVQIDLPTYSGRVAYRIRTKA